MIVRAIRSTFVKVLLMKYRNGLMTSCLTDLSMESTIENGNKYLSNVFFNDNNMWKFQSQQLFFVCFTYEEKFYHAINIAKKIGLSISWQGNGIYKGKGCFILGFLNETPIVEVNTKVLIDNALRVIFEFGDVCDDWIEIYETEHPVFDQNFNIATILRSLYVFYKEKIPKKAVEKIQEFSRVNGLLFSLDCKRPLVMDYQSKYLENVLGEVVKTDGIDMFGNVKTTFVITDQNINIMDVKDVRKRRYLRKNYHVENFSISCPLMDAIAKKEWLTNVRPDVYFCFTKLIGFEGGERWILNNYIDEPKSYIKEVLHMLKAYPAERPNDSNYCSKCLKCSLNID